MQQNSANKTYLFQSSWIQAIFCWVLQYVCHSNFKIDKRYIHKSRFYPVMYLQMSMILCPCINCSIKQDSFSGHEHINWSTASSHIGVTFHQFFKFWEICFAVIPSCPECNTFKWWKYGKISGFLFNRCWFVVEWNKGELIGQEYEGTTWLEVLSWFVKMWGWLKFLVGLIHSFDKNS